MKHKNEVVHHVPFPQNEQVINITDGRIRLNVIFSFDRSLFKPQKFTFGNDVSYFVAQVKERRQGGGNLRPQRERPAMDAGDAKLGCRSKYIENKAMPQRARWTYQKQNYI